MQSPGAGLDRVSADAFARRLSAMAALTVEDRDRMRSCPSQRERWRPGREIASQGATSGRIKVVLGGWACRQRIRPNGVRQIFDFLLPGDLIGRAPHSGEVALTAVAAITSVETAEISAPHFGSTLARVLDCMKVEEEARLHDHLMRLGRLSAYERMAHLLLELHDRLDRVGQARDWRFTLPLTQEVLADALGLSIVHVNRTLQQLRREGLIDTHGGVVTLLQPKALSAAADYTLAAGHTLMDTFA